MRKKIVAGIASAAVLLAGASAAALSNLPFRSSMSTVSDESSIDDFEANSAATEAMQEASDVTTSVKGSDISTTASSIGNGIEDINAAVSQGVAKIQTEVNKGVSQVQAAAQPTTEGAPESKTITLNAVQNTQYGTFTFESVKINYQFKYIDFICVLPDKSTFPTGEHHEFGINDKSYCIDKSGSKLSLSGYNSWIDDGKKTNMEFYFNDISDLSLVDITYAFRDDMPLITATITIPGI